MSRSKQVKYILKPYEPFESNGYIGIVKDKHGKDKEAHIFVPATSDETRVDSMVGITMCMLSHPAFQDLKPRIRMLYIYAKAQYNGMVDREQFNKDYKDTNMAGHKEYIYLNDKLLTEVFKVYGKGSRGLMYSDIAILVEHGFLEPIIREKNQRTIYKLSSEWLNWQPHRKYVLQGKKYEWVDC